VGFLASSGEQGRIRRSRPTGMILPIAPQSTRFGARGSNLQL
jgi:hypothetical protein